MTGPSGEFELIDWIRRRVPAHERVPLGIGDDAALVQLAASGRALVTVDMLLDGVHFRLSEVSARRIGWKALAVNLSDIAAMGGRALAAVVSVALPRGNAAAVAQELQEGMDTLAARFGVCIAGGDTNTWDGPLVISITVLGEPLAAQPVLRSGAQPGDWILVTGDLGGSLAGKHLDFTPRLDEAAALISQGPLHAMIDISDGLAADLHHILEESGVGAELEASQIPVSSAALAASQQDGRSALEHALCDGEDFELLLTTDPVTATQLLATPLPGTQLTKIGQITAARDCWLIQPDGSREPLAARGWKHAFGTA